MNVIGTVSHLIGRAVAIKADGTERLLALGDEIYADEMVRVAPDASIEIAMEGGDPVRLEGGQNWLASSETYIEADNFDLTEATADVESIQAAILAGADPTDVAEETAAGGNAPAAGGQGNEGSSTVNIERTAEEVDPTAGYETIGFARGDDTREVFAGTNNEQINPENNEQIAPETVEINLAGPATVIEGENATYTITISRAPTTDMTISVTTGHITTDDGDLVPVVLDVVIPAGQTSVNFDVETIDDAYADSGERYSVNITSLSGGGFNAVDVVSDSVVTTILDQTGSDDIPGPEDIGATVSINGDTAVWEGNQATFTVTTDTISNEDIIVNVRTVEPAVDPATGNVDYVTVTTAVTIPAGQPSVDFIVETNDDALADSGEKFIAEIVDASGAEFEAVAVDATADSVETTIVDASDPTPPPGIPGTPDSPDAGATVSISGDTAVWEGNQATFTVTTDTISNEDIIVNVRTVEPAIDPATGDVDYVTVTTAVTIPAGQPSVDFIVETNDDALADSGEKFIAEIVDASGAEFEAVAVDATADSVETTIVDASDPTPPPGIPGTPDSPDAGATVSISGDTAVWEGNQATFTVTTDTISNEDIIVNVRTVEPAIDPATGDVDYVTVTTAVTIPAGQPSVDFIVETNDDALADSGEKFIAEIVDASGAEFEAVAVDATADSVETTIVDASDPTPPPGIPGTPDSPDAGATVSISGDTAVWEGNQATFTVTTDTISNEDIIVNVRTVEPAIDPATGDVDYVTVTTAVTIPAGQPSVDFIVETNDDALADSGEKFIAEIVDASGAEFEAVAVDATADSVETTIVDASDPTPPPGIPGTPDSPDAGATVSISGDTAVWEGNQATFTVTTDTISNEDIIVNVRTVEPAVDPATGNVDYVTVTTAVTIPAGQPSVDFIVETNDDALADSGEKFIAEIVDASGAEFEAVAVDATADSVETTIVDASDPTPPPGIPGTPDSPDAGATVSISGDTAVWEGNQATFTVTTDTISNEDIIVNVRTVEPAIDPATGDVDYVTVTTAVTIPAGQPSVDFIVETNDDALADSGEKFIAEIVDASGAEFEAVAVDATADSVETTIVDASDPTPPPGIPGTPDSPDAGATVSISGDTAVWEGNQATFTVTTDTISNEDIIVNVRTVEPAIDPATGDVDYVTVTTAVTIPAGQPSVDFIVETNDDALADSGEKFIAEIVDASGAEFEAVAVDATADSVETTIVDASDPTPPPGIPGTPDSPDAGATVSISGDTAVWEGNQATFTVTTDTISNEDIIVNVRTVEPAVDPATGDVDYVTVTTAVTIPAGQPSVDFIVETNDDALADSGEKFIAEIVDASGAEFEAVAVDATADSVETTIVDASDPTPPPGIPGTPDSPDAGATVSISGDTAVWEGNQATFTVTTDTISNEDIIVNVRTVEPAVDPATGNVDYVTVTTAVTIPAGQPSVDFIVETNDDALADSGEKFIAEIVDASGAEFEAVAVDATADSVETTIVDASDPTPPPGIPGTPDSPDAGTELSISGATSTLEGNGVEYTVSLTEPTLEEMTVEITIAHAPVDGTQNTDITPEVITVTIPQGGTEVKFTVDNLNDLIAENPEDYVVSITDNSNGGYEAVTLGQTEVKTTINDDDSVSVQSVTSDTQTEGTLNNDLVHTVVMSGASVNDETYSFSLTDTTTQTVDHGAPVFSNSVTYNASTGLITVPAGVTTFTITTTVTDDALADSGEFYTINVGGVDATGTILDETDPYEPTDPDQPNERDVGATVSISGDTAVWEGNQATFTVTTDTISNEDIIVNVRTVEPAVDPATGDVDYVTVTTAVTIPAGQPSVDFIVETNDDALADSGEKFIAEIVDASGAEFEAVAVDATADSVETTIVDASDPTPPPGIPGTPDSPDAGATVSISGDTAVWEGNQATFTVTTDTISNEDIIVNVRTVEPAIDPATGDVDYVTVTTAVTIPAGQPSVDFIVETNDDALADSGEKFIAEIVDASGAEFEAVAVDATADSVETTIVDASDPTPPPGIPGTPDSPDAGATVSISGDTAVWEGNQATFTVTTDTISNEDIIVNVRTVEPAVDPATGNVDYVTVTTAVTIPAGQPSVDFIVETNDDALADSGEKFIAEIVDASGAEFEAVAVDATADSVETTIVDASDPTPPPGIPGTPDSPDAGATVSISGDTAVWEGNQATFTVTTDTISNEDIIVNVRTVEPAIDPATGDVDYVTVTTAVTIPAGQPSVDFIVETNDDALADSGEKFIAEIVDASGAEFEAVAVDATADSVETTIVDASDPTPPPGIPGTPDSPDAGATVSISGDTAVWEGNQATFTVTTDTISNEDIIVNVRTVEPAVDPATGNVDYVTVTTAVTIPAGQPSVDFIVETNDDALADSGEKFIAEIVDASGAEFEAVAVDATADSVETTIVDASDPTPPPGIPGTPDSPDAGATVSISGDTAVWEGNQATFTVTTDTISNEDIIVNVRTVEPAVDPATGNVDYVTVTTAVTIPAGQPSVDFIVETNDDALADSGEKFIAEIVDASGAEFEAVAVDATADSVETTIVDASDPTPPPGIPGTPDSPDAGATVSISGDTAVWEGNQATFTVTTDTISNEDIIVNVRTVEPAVDPATGNVDYVTVTTAVTIPAGQPSVDFIVETNDDALADSGEKFIAEIVDASGAEFEAVAVDATADSVETTIVDASDPTPPPGIPGTPDSPDAGTELSISGATSTLEGNGVEYTVSLTEPTLEEMTVEITIAHAPVDGTQNTDITPEVITVTIPQGGTEVKFTVDNLNDLIAENPEDYVVSITDNSNGGYEAVTLGQTEVKTTINDDDSVSVQSVTSDTQTEGTLNNDLVHTVVMSGASVNDETYSFSLTDTTTQTVDHGAPVFSNSVTYNASTGLITVPAGVTTFTITTTVTDDALADSGEFYTINVGGVDATGTILDETDPYEPTDPDQPNERDVGATVSISGDTAVWEGNQATFTVTTDTISNEDIIVNVRTVEPAVDPATGDVDYVTVTTAVTIPAGQPSVDFIVETNDDALADSGEKFIAEIVDASGAEFEAVAVDATADSVETTIVDASDPTPPPGIPGTPDSPDAGATVSISGDTAVWEGNQATFTVTTDTISNEDIIVNVRTVEPAIDPATGDVDYVTVTTAVTIPAGQPSVDFIVETNDDALADSGEKFIAEIVDASGAEFEAVAVDATADSVETTIVDASDPTPPPGIPGTPDSPDAGATVSISGDTAVWEGNQATFTVTTDTISNEDIIVNVRTVEPAVDPATGNVDYVTVTTAVTIPAGQPSVDFIVETNDDALADSGEKFIAEIVDASGAEFEAVAVDATADSVETTIVDASDPTPPPGIPGTPDSPDAGATVSISGDTAVWEGNQATFTVTTDTISNEDIIVNVRTVEPAIDPATGDVDYVTVTTAVTIPAGQPSVDFIVETNDDALADSGEKFIAEIVDASGAEFEAVAVDATADSVETTIVDASDPTPPPGIPGTPDSPDAGATVSISGDTAVWEGNQATFTVTTDTISNEDIIVNVRTVEPAVDPATGNVDYVTVTTAVTIPAGQPSVDFIVETNDDALADSGEKFIAEIVDASGAEFEAVAVDATADSVETTIVDASDPTPPPGIPGTPDSPDAGATVSISGDTAVWEGNQATFTVTTDTISNEDIIVNVRTVEPAVDPATGNVDYVTVTTAVTIPAGQPSVDFIVETNDDALADSGEKFIAEIVDASGAEFEAVAVDATADSVETTIVDASDPTPPPGIPGTPDSPDAGATVSISGDTAVWEGNQATFTVTTDTISNEDIIVNVRTVEPAVDPATGNVDYVTVTTAVTIPAGQPSVDFIVETNDDALADSGEKFIAEIVDASGAEFEAVAVDATADSVETTIVDASDPTPPPGIPGTPDSPDAGATVSISGDTAVWEGNQATFTVTTDTISNEDIIVNVRTVEPAVDPATGDVDYVTVTTAVTIPAGQPSVDFIVETNDDALADSGEKFIAEIVDASGAEFEAVAVDATADSVETTIVDASDPTPPPGIPGTPDSPDAGTELSISGATSTLEGNGVEYTVSLTEPTLEEMTVEITIAHAPVDGTQNTDITPEVITVTIPQGGTEVKFTVDNLNDLIAENPEDYVVSITDNSNGGYEAVTLGQTEVKTTINDDDSVSVQSVTSDTQTEGTLNNDLVHTVVMSGASVNDETYSFSLTDTTTQTVDHGAPVFSNSVTYNASTGLITVPAGVTTFTITTTVTDDALADSGEFYTINVGGVDATGTILDETDPYEPTDPDQPNERDVGATVSISGDTAVWEGNQATFTVTTDTISNEDIIVNVRTVEPAVDPATGNVDYVTVTTAVTIPAGQPSVDFIVETNDDALADSGEKFIAEIVDASGAEFEAVAVDATADSVETTIVDASDPTPPPGIPGTPDSPDAGATVSISGDTAVWEGNQATFTVTTDTISNEDIIVNVRTVEPAVDPATGDVDYVTVTTAVTIPAGQPSVDFIVETNDDALADSGEKFIAEIVDASGVEFEAVAVDATADSVETTIVDASDPTPPPGIPGTPDSPDAGATVSISGDTAVWEGNQATFTVTTDTISNEDIIVNVRTVEPAVDPATGNVDYVTVTTAVTIPAGQPSVDFIVETNDDALADSGEKFIAEIVDASGAEFEAVAVDATADSVETTIVDASDPTPPPGIPGTPDSPDAGATVSISGDTAVWEGNQATFTVTTDTISNEDIIVNVRTVEPAIDPATGDVDYVTVTTAVTIPAGQPSVDFIVETNDDALADSGEKFIAEIVDASGVEFEAVAVDATADSVETTIVDASDPTPPPGIPGTPDSPDAGATVSISGDTAVWEGNQATFTVTTDTISNEDIIVNVRTVEPAIDPATGDVDYVTVTTAVTIPAGQPSVDFIVETNDDALADSGEKFIAEIVDASGAEFEAVAVDATADSVETTIVDASDPTPPPGIPGTPDSPDAGATVSISGDTAVWEGNQATFTVTTDTISNEDIIVNVRTVEPAVDPATGNVDYVTVTTAVTIPAGQPSVDFIVETNDDALADSGEKFIAEIVDASGAEFEAVAVDATADSVETTIVDASDPTPPPGIPGTPDSPDAGATVSISGDTAVWEGNQATFTVTTDTISNEDIIVNVRTVEPAIDPATGDVDYVTVTTAVTIPAGQPSVDFIVETNDDALADSGEKFIAEIVDASGAEFEAVAVDATADSVETTIVDASDPTPPPGIPGTPDSPDAGATVSISGDTAVWEGNQATFTVTTDTISNEDIIVNVRTVEPAVDPATGNVDYVTVTTAVTIPAGQPSVDFIVETNDDALADSGEKFIAEIVDASGAEFEAVAVDATADSVETTIVDASDPTPPPGIPGTPDSPDAGATVSISGDTAVWEGNQATFTVTTDTISNEDIIVNVRTVEPAIDPATGDVDYVTVTTAVTIPAGQPSVDFIVETNDDALADSGEKFIAEIVDASGAEFEAVAVDATADSVETTIVDASDPTPPPGIPGTPDSPDAGATVSISGDTAVWEGNQATFTVTTDTISNEDIIVNVRTVEPAVDPATGNVDYVTVTTAVTIPAGQPSVDFIVETNDDALADSGEKFIAEIVDASGAEFEAVAVDATADSVETTIVDASDPTPPPGIPGTPDSPDAGATVSISGDTAVWEGNQATFTVTTDTISNEDIIVNVRTVEPAVDPATGNVDYVTVTTAVTIPAGQPSVDFIVETNDDALADSGEKFIAEIVDASGAEFEAVAVDATADSVETTIVDASDPTPPPGIPGTPDSPDAGATVSISGDTAVWEGNQATFTVTTDTISNEDIIVNVRTVEPAVDPATGNVDYVTVTTAVTIPAGQPSVDFIVETNDDALADSGEKFIAEIVDASGAEFEAVAVDATADSVETTIVDASDPTPPPGIPGTPDSPDAGATVSISGDTAVWEGNQATFTVTTDTISNEDIIVNVRTVEPAVDPATGDVDYVTVTTAVTIPAGQPSVDFIVETNDDALADSGEKFIAEIVDASGAEFEAVAVDATADSVETTIVDASDPTPPPGIPGTPDSPDAGATVSISGDVKVEEGNIATFTVTTDTVSTEDIIVNVRTREPVSNPATGGVDYVTVTTAVTILAGETSADFTVTTNEDGVVESDEYFIAEIVDASGAEFESVAVDNVANSVTTLIDDDDHAPVAQDDPGFVSGGLASEYYGYRQGIDGNNLTSVQQVKDYVEANDAEITFTSTQINYGYDDANGNDRYDAGESVGTGDLADDVAAGGGVPSNLEAFLKQDAASIEGSSTVDATDGVLHISGMIDIPADGTYTFDVQHDDGFVIYVDGVDIFNYDNITPPTESIKTVELTGGKHTVEVFYWDQGGNYVFDLQLLDGADNNVWVAENLSYPTTEPIVTEEDTAVDINLVANDSDLDGDLDPSSIQIETGPANGTVTVHADGTVTYDPADDFYGVDTFTYTIRDLAGNVSNVATVTVAVNAVNDLPELSVDGPISVSEEAIPVVGLREGAEDNSDTTTGTGTITITDVDSSEFFISLEGPAGVTAGTGQDAVVWNWVADTDDTNDTHGVLTGSNSVTGEIVATVTVSDPVDAGNGTQTVNYEFELISAITHPDGNGENFEQLNFVANVSDGRDTAQTNFVVNVEDDVPVSGDISDSIIIPRTLTNVMLVMDFSGSMNDPRTDGDGNPLPTYFEEMQSALVSMLEAYDSIGHVAVQIVTFATDSDIPEVITGDNGWVSADDAIAYLESLSNSDMSGWTNYDAAIAEAETAFAQSTGKIDGATNVSYFLSDGAPTAWINNDGSIGDPNNPGEDTGTVGIDATEQTAWEAFVTANDIDSYAIGFGGADLSELEPVAYNGTGAGSERDAIDATAEGSNLTDVLLETVIQPSVGNLFGSLASGGFGADGNGHVKSMVIDGETYLYNSVTNETTNSGGSVVGTGAVFTVTTIHSGVLTVDMSSGDYSYTPVASLTESITESFTFSLEDSDGDVSNGTVTLNVSREVEPVAILVSDTDQVFEADMPAGTNDQGNNEIATGNILSDDTIPDGFGLSGLSIVGGNTTDNGTTFTVTTAQGNTLVVDKATGDYTYTLINAVAHQEYVNTGSTITLASDDFNSDESGWSGTNVSLDSGSLRIDGSGDVATKTFDFGDGYADQVVTISFDYTTLGTWESEDSFVITVNGTSQTISNNDASGTFTTAVSLTTSGIAVIELENSSSRNNEDVRFDNLVITGPEIISNQLDTVVDSFTYTVSDQFGTESTANLDITIHDDAPQASPQSVDLLIEPVTTNLSFIIDMSGSMDSSDRQLAKEAVEALVAEYEAIGNVNLNIVEFWGNNHSNTGWVDSSYNYQYQTGTSGTDIEQGLRSMVEDSYSGNQPVADQDIMYFFGDGNTYDAYETDFNAYTGITDPANNAWQDFVTGGQIDKLFSYSVNTSSVLSDIEHLADNGENLVSQPAVNIANINDLNAAVTATAGVFTEGSLLQDVSGNAIIEYGADGGRIDVVTIGAVTVNYDASSPVQDVQGEHGVFTLNFLTGAYTYQSETIGGVDVVETVNVSIADNDGDTLDTVLLDININFSPEFNQIQGDDFANSLVGTDANESISGLAGADTLQGGGGNDILTGGDDADMFVWTKDDLGTTLSPDADTVVDFNTAEGDVLNLADVLQDGSHVLGAVEHDGHLQLQITTDSSSDVIQTVDVESVAVSNDSDAATQLQQLLDNNNIDDGIN
ncbi:immunoglobulin-like domain-containing protein [Neptuniibacter sp. PT34_22]|uniref:immunoglobulin-like domain-containing protein n=1 Tax=Neptuniibacter sp. PT34_22 TaxID=3398205 RepID=UPI0039F45E71